MKIKGFTLAEVLITLAIIGVVAALTIPSVIVNTQQSEFKTGLKKAVSVLNQAITMNQALDGISPYDSAPDYNGDGIFDITDTSYVQQGSAKISPDSINLGSMLTRHMSIMGNKIFKDGTNVNVAFYTTDGMRFEFPFEYVTNLKLHEDENFNFANSRCSLQAATADQCILGCGSFGLLNNPNGTMAPPCFIVVDVNGDRKPNPKYSDADIAANQEQTNTEKGIIQHKVYETPDFDSKKLSDIFTIMITESKAIPYGVLAQKAMYQARDKK